MSVPEGRRSGKVFKNTNKYTQVDLLVFLNTLYIPSMQGILNTRTW